MIEPKDLVRGLQDKTLNTDELSSWDWELVSAHQKLSEGFIEEFSDKIEKIIKRQGGTLPKKHCIWIGQACPAMQCFFMRVPRSPYAALGVFFGALARHTSPYFL